MEVQSDRINIQGKNAGSTANVCLAFATKINAREVKSIRCVTATLTATSTNTATCSTTSRTCQFAHSTLN